MYDNEEKILKHKYFFNVNSKGLYLFFIILFLILNIIYINNLFNEFIFLYNLLLKNLIIIVINFKVSFVLYLIIENFLKNFCIQISLMIDFVMASY